MVESRRSNSGVRDLVWQERPDQMGGVERRLANQGLRIDDQPRLPSGGQDVAQMEIPIGDGVRRAILHEPPAQFDRAFDQALGEWPAGFGRYFAGKVSAYCCASSVTNRN